MSQTANLNLSTDDVNNLHINFKLFLIGLISLPAVISCLYATGLPQMAKDLHYSLYDFQIFPVINLLTHTVGALFYAVMANSYGRKKTIQIGLVLTTFGALLIASCHPFTTKIQLLVGFFLMFLGANVGLILVVILIKDHAYKLLRTTATVMLGLCLLPGAAVYIGAELLRYFNWPSLFIGAALYSSILLLSLSFFQFPAIAKILNFSNIRRQFTNTKILSCGILLGSISACFHLFNGQIPRIAFNLIPMSKENFALASNIPSLGMLLGTLLARGRSRFSDHNLVYISGFWSLLILGFFFNYLSIGGSSAWAYFIFTAFLYIGLQVIYPIVISLALQSELNCTATAGVLLTWQSTFAALLVAASNKWCSFSKFSLVTGYFFCLITGLCFFWLVQSIQKINSSRFNKNCA